MASTEPQSLSARYSDAARAEARERARAKLAEADRYWTDERLDAAYADHDRKIEEARGNLGA